MNIIEAKHVVVQLSDAEQLILVQAEQGVSVETMPADGLKNLHDKGYVRVAPFHNPSAVSPIPGVVLTEDGRKLVEALRQSHEKDETALVAEANDQKNDVVEEKVRILEEPRSFDKRKADRTPKRPAVDSMLLQPK